MQGAGALNVFFGSSTGLQAAGNVLFQGSQPAQGGPVAARPRPGDGFGAAVAKGLFNDDGSFDLAVGAPQKTVGTHAAAGALSVFYASGGGVLTPGPTFFQGMGGVGGVAESFDFFGAAME